MPSFNIPTGIEFRDLSGPEHYSGFPRLCFRHAVQGALAGHDIEVNLSNDSAFSYRYCDKCVENDTDTKEQQP